MDTFKDACIKHKIACQDIGYGDLEVEYRGEYFYINTRDCCISDGYCVPMRVTPASLMLCLHKLTQ